MSEPEYQHYQCDASYDYDMRQQNPMYQGRGITTWNIDHQYTLPNNALITPNNSATLVFTGTAPKCYSAYNTIPAEPGTNKLGRDSCCIVFNAWRYGSGTVPDTIQLSYNLNGQNIGGCFISGVAQNGATQGFDFANTAGTLYNDMGENTFIIQNLSQRTIQVDHPKIYRTYKMCNLAACEGGNCPTVNGTGTICCGGVIPQTNSSFDLRRDDIPCSCAACGGLSYTQVHDISKQGNTLPAGQTLSWAFDFSTLSGYNYQGKSICLFNFNGISPSTTTNDADIELEMRLNGNSITNFYLSKYSEQGLFPSDDLATRGTLYHDNDQNTVSIVNKSTVNVQMASSGGGIDIYRLFQTYVICEECSVSCEVECQSCNTCQGCEVSCQSACEVSCQSGCQLTCQTCNAPCVICYACYATCEDCQTSCELNCQTGCEVSCQPCEDCQSCITCQACNVSCQGGCQACEPNCQVSCNICYSCQTGCEECYECENCYNCQACYVGCDTPCVATCQTGNY